jgi:hypothetical protein
VLEVLQAALALSIGVSVESLRRLAREYVAKRAVEWKWANEEDRERLSLQLFVWCITSGVVWLPMEGAAALEREFDSAWPEVRHAWELDNAPRLGAARALTGPLKTQSHADTPEALARLREAVEDELEREDFRKAVGWPWPLHHAEEEAEGMAAPLARLLVYLRARFCPREDSPASAWLKTLERQGREGLAEWRTQGCLEGVPPQESPWQKLTPSLAASLVAQVLWFDRVAAEIERSRPEVTVLPLSVVRDLAETHWAPHRQLVLLDGRAVLRKDGAELAEVPLLDPTDFEVIQRGVERLRSVTGQRVIRHLAREAYRLHKATPGRADVAVEGGFSGLAEAIGERSKKAAETVRDVLRAGQDFKRRWANGDELGGLWTYHNMVSEARGRRALLVVTVGTVLRPYFAMSKLPAGERFGVPVLPMPPFVGERKNDWAGQAVFQFLLEAELVARRLELVEHGGVRLTTADFERLAAKAGLPHGSWRKVLDRWTQDGNDGPAMLERVGTDRFNLSNREPYKAAREWLLRGGQISAAGRQRRTLARAHKREK